VRPPAAGRQYGRRTGGRGQFGRNASAGATANRIFDGIQGRDDGDMSALTDELQGRFDFGLHRAGGEMAVTQISLRFRDGNGMQILLLRRLEVDGGTGDIGGDDETIGADFFGEDGAGQILVDNGIHAIERTPLTGDRNTSAAAANHNKTHIDQFADLPFFHDGDRARRCDHTAVAFGCQAGRERAVGRLGFGQDRADGFGRGFKGGIVFIDNHIADHRNERLLGMDAEFHERGIEGRFDHIADLTLRLRHQNLQRQAGNRIAALLLQE
jgi:hypothetical protein